MIPTQTRNYEKHKLKKRENFWIIKLKTLQPYGFNYELNFPNPQHFCISCASVSLKVICRRDIKNTTPECLIIYIYIFVCICRKDQFEVRFLLFCCSFILRSLFFNKPRHMYRVIRRYIAYQWKLEFFCLYFLLIYDLKKLSVWS